jgi:hypothetical protein
MEKDLAFGKPSLLFYANYQRVGVINVFTVDMNASSHFGVVYKVIHPIQQT